MESPKNCHNITEILLKVALRIITLQKDCGLNSMVRVYEFSSAQCTDTTLFYKLCHWLTEKTLVTMDTPVSATN